MGSPRPRPFSARDVLVCYGWRIGIAGGFGTRCSSAGLFWRRASPPGRARPTSILADLLGVQSDASKLLAPIAGIIRGKNPEQELRQPWVHTADRQRRLIQEKLRFFARRELHSAWRIPRSEGGHTQAEMSPSRAFFVVGGFLCFFCKVCHVQSWYR